MKKTYINPVCVTDITSPQTLLATSTIPVTPDEPEVEGCDVDYDPFQTTFDAL